MRRLMILAAIVAATVTTTAPADADAHTYYNVGRVAGHPGCSTTLPRVIRAHVQCLDGWHRTLVRCAEEDSRNCYWNAAHRGNGRGRSFIDVHGRAYYLPRGAR